MPLNGSYQVLVQKIPEEYAKAKETFTTFLDEEGLTHLVQDTEKLFQLLVGTLEQREHPTASGKTNTFFHAADLEQTANWLYAGYQGRKVNGRKFAQKNKEYYDTARYRFGMHRELAVLGLSDSGVENQPDANLTALFGRETKTNPMLTALFEYAVGTLVEKPNGKFLFQKGIGRELADSLKEHYKLETKTVSYERSNI